MTTPDFTAEDVERYKKMALEYASRALLPPEDEDIPSPLDARAPDLSKDLAVATGQNSAYEGFMRMHPGRGALKVQVTIGSGAFPLDKSVIEVSKQFGDEKIVLYKSTTDSSGIVENITLPALPRQYSQSVSTAAESATDYSVSVMHPSFDGRQLLPVNIYDGVVSILPVTLFPVI